VFEDYHYHQRIAVVVRWFLIIVWVYIHNSRPDFGWHYSAINVLLLAAVLVNGHLHWRIRRGQPIGKAYVLALSIADLTAITLGIILATRFNSLGFVLYYPALLGLSLVFSSRRVAFAVTAIVGMTYAAVSFLLSPGVSIERGEDEALVGRIAVMFAVVVVGTMMTEIERGRRREAVAAERERLQENLELQRRAQAAELALQRERIRISEEIHDGAAQTAFVLTLGLERCCRLAEGRGGELEQKLRALHIQSRQAQWELRYPINLGPLFEGRTLGEVLRNHTRNFETIASIPTNLSLIGVESRLPGVTKQKLFSVVHNALTNVYRHARASRAEVELAFDDEATTLSVRDNGVGLLTVDLGASPGHGISNIKRIAQELGGSSEIRSDPGKGTTVTVTLPRQLHEEEDDRAPGDDR
jgi:signal transduction histidine kinase